ncbi:4'-phosphopantetheinyl transferase family protein [Flavihumibacter stibioxidans]|nr:4'-phosphopantetheinyl transferase superfamily protein [Flavihumibacter stibioxidans]
MGLLSEDELIRASRFRFEQDRLRFMASRGLLRNLLGPYLDKEPQLISFRYNAFGKPFLANAPVKHQCEYAFNLSHSGEVVLFAITLNAQIGIDIELIRPSFDTGAVGKMFLAMEEITLLETSGEEMRSELFFRFWTRKEAFTKAMGKGLSFPLEQCDVSLIDESRFRPVMPEGFQYDGSTWYAMDLLARDGFASAIAVNDPEKRISCFEYVI